MKNIYIKTDESLSSILKRVKKQTAKEINLIVPREALLLQSRTNLDLFKEEVASYGKTVNIISNDPFLEKVTSHSPSLKTKSNVFASWLGESRVFKGALFVVVLLILGASAYFVLPRATVKLQPKKADLQNVLQDYPSQKIENSGKIVRRFAVEPVNTEATKAEGIIYVKNQRGQTQYLVSETRFLSEKGKLFYSLEDISVPAGGERTVRVAAACPNPEKPDPNSRYSLSKSMQKMGLSCQDGQATDYNLGPTSFSLPACCEQKMACCRKVSAYSKESFKGGGFKKEEILTKQQIEQAKEQTQQELKEQLKSQLLQREDLVVNPDQQWQTKIVKQSSSSSAKERVDSFNVSLEMSLSGQGYSKKVVEEALVKELAPDLVGKGQEDLKEVLNRHPGVASSVVEMWPFWVKKVPDKVYIELK